MDERKREAAKSLEKQEKENKHLETQIEELRKMGST
jgi:hypothetical protein